MMRISLNGSWRLRKEGEKETLPATVPGCNFLDLMDNGVIENPHYADREKDVQWIARENWEYSREFEADEALLSQNKVELVALSLDTLAVISLNGREIARTDNIYRTYIFDVKRYLNPGKNRIQILFLSPFPYIKERQKLLRLPHNSMGAPGCPHIRKVPSHFGWDFAPMVPQCGIVKDIFLRGYSRGKLYDLECRQEHGDGRVSLKIKCRVDQMEREDLVCRVRVTDPDGGVLEHTEPVSSNLAQVCFDIEKPQLWWCSGLGEQPLYRVDCALEAAGEAVDARSMEIGLRTIVLSKAKDVHGKNFCFQVNGVSIFAKGANWIPADCFSPRISRAVLEQRIRAMKRANMNMVRVWGGGFYESDDFYELCDRYGILVWQDMCFACSGYPFALDDFKENVFREIRDNVMRLRHHASLALWCGNNEIESMSAAWSYRRGIIRDTGEFFYKILPNWVRKFDDVTEYWSCSPSSGEYMKNINSDDFGDTHLWNVWHGMRSVQFYRKRYTRFCSEFGLQSYPSMNCLREVIPEDQRYLKSTALDAHQKCGDGDTKMLYYVNKRFWEPKEFKDLVYLTQLAQLECIRDATEHWRRNRGRCNGALYWQLNDCWPGTSWSGMDYYGNYLALMYGARKFNEPVAVSLENNWRQIKVFGLNDTCTAVPGRCVWRLELFDGTVVEQGEFDCKLDALTSKRLAEFDFKNKIEKSKESQGVFVIRFYNQQGDLLSQRRAFLYRENACTFPDAGLETEIAAVGGKAVITVKARQYARFVALDMESCHQPFSDNYFDLSAGESAAVEIEIPPQWSREEVQRRLRVHSLADVEPQMSRARGKLKQLSIMAKPVNVANWISRFFDN